MAANQNQLDLGKFKHTDKQHSVLLKGLEDLYLNKLLTDVILCAEGEEFPCHRNVLAASSPYFRVMFTSDVKEQEEPRVEIHEVTASDLRAVIHYIYTAWINIDSDNAQSIFITAHMLGIVNLVDHCAGFMQSQLCPNNVIEIYIFASFYSCDKLVKTCRTFILESFRDVCPTEGFLSLPVDDLDSVLSEDNLGVESEEEVYRAILTWIDFDKDKRSEHLNKLLKNLRICLISNDFIDVMKENGILSENKRILHQLNKFQKKTDRGSLLIDPQLEIKSSIFSLSRTARLGMLKRRMIIFSGGASDSEKRSLTCFDPTTNKNYYGIKPHSSFDFKHKIDHHRVLATDDNKLFFLGGVLYEDYHFEPTAAALDAVFTYDEKLAFWSPKSPMLTPRCAFSVVATQGKIFVTGGKTTFPRGGPLFFTECYIISDDQWLPLADMPIGLYHHASAVHNNSIYVFGGIEEGEEHVNTVFQYNINSDSWTFIETMMGNLRAEFSAITYKDKIYLIGGGNKTENVTTMEIFHPKSRRWHIGTEFPEDRKTMSAILIEDSIYVCGGVKYIGARGNRRSRMVESRDLYRYDLITNDWNHEVKLVQYANIQTCATCILNTKFLQESDFVSSD